MIDSPDPRSLLYRSGQLSPDEAQALARQTLGQCDDGELFLVVDVSAELAGGCRAELDHAAPMAAGMVTLRGYCDGGLAESGFALEIAGSVAGRRLCADGTDEPVSMSLSGRVAVLPL